MVEFYKAPTTSDIRARAENLGLSASAPLINESEPCKSSGMQFLTAFKIPLFKLSMALLFHSVLLLSEEQAGISLPPCCVPSAEN